MPEQKDAVIHTLLTREIRPIGNWRGWLACWQMAENLEQMENLLHVGYNMSLHPGWCNEDGEMRPYNAADRHLFYFSIADGWTDSNLLKLPTDGDKKYDAGNDLNGWITRKKPCELRGQLARKAFDILCINFFNMELVERYGRRIDESNEVWEDLIASEQLFMVIQNFFRAEKGEFSNNVKIRNLSHRDDRSSNEQLAVEFLLNLAKFMWRWKESNTCFGARKDEENKILAATRARLDNAKPWMVEVLVRLERLDVLQEWILELDTACLSKLTEIALGTKLNGLHHRVVETRPVANLDEACYAGSSAAWFLKKHELMTRENRRLRIIATAEKKKIEADRTIKELTTT